MVNQYNGFIVGNNGHIYSTTNGITWKINEPIATLYYNYNFYDICVHNTHIYIVGSNGIILYSLNNGTSWLYNRKPTNLNLLNINILPNNNIYILGESNLLLNNISVSGYIQLRSISTINEYILLYNFTSLSFSLSDLYVNNYSLYTKFIPY